MKELGVLTCFYQNRRQARQGLRVLRLRGIRSALLYKPVHGWQRVSNPSPLRALVLGLVTGLLLGTVLVLLKPQWLTIPKDWLAMPVEFGITLGVLLAMVNIFIRRGVSHRLLRQFSRLMVSDEILLLVQAPAKQLPNILDRLRASSQDESAVFALRQTRFAAHTMAAPMPREPMAVRQLENFAGRLAASHHIRPPTRRDTPLLEHLGQAERLIRLVHDWLAQGIRLDQGISPIAEWILDNTYIVLGHIQDVRANLPKQYYHELPVLEDGPDAGTLRIHKLAAELVFQTDCRIDRQNIDIFLRAYQAISPLSIGELWAFPLMIRMALIEKIHQLSNQVLLHQQDHEWADFWANRLLTAARREPSKLPFLTADLAHQRPWPSPFFAYHLAGHLYDEQSAMAPIESWIESAQGKPMSEIVPQEQARQAGDQMTMGNAISSLRRLSLMEWFEVFEAHSQVDPILGQDPAEVYAKMDFGTRDRYRCAVESVSKGGTVPETQVAGIAIQMARQADPSGDPRRRHVGYYLIGPGVAELETRCQSHPKPAQAAIRWLRAHSATVYLAGVAGLTAAALAVAIVLARLAGAPAGLLVVVAALAVLPASELAVQLANWILIRVLPAQGLPKMNYEKTGIPDPCRTIAVTHTLLYDAQTIAEQIRGLEVNYLANDDPNISWGLLADPPDASQAVADDDEPLLQAAIAGIEELNARYGPGHFLLMVRPRAWSETQQMWIAPERKRGKLEDLNRLINTGQDGEFLRVGEVEALREMRFVITLDADTRLTRGSARRMIETMAHPLNRPRVAKNDRAVAEGYAIVQPRVATSLPSATASVFTRLFSDPTGSDPYCRLVSDAYQDLAGEGMYQGKGIYDPQTFGCVLDGVLPKEAILSHDLIEGVHARTGWASDIELLEDFPLTYLAWAQREHRWIRGDWQIAEYWLPWAPYGSSKTQSGIRWIRNPLSLLNRWKILDNLRRSLVGLSSIAMLLVAWLSRPSLGIVFSALLGVLLLFAPLTEILNAIAIWPPGRMHLNRSQFLRRLVYALVGMAMLPYQAALSLDAAIRTIWRRWVSRRHLLEWTTAQFAGGHCAHRMKAFLGHMMLISAMAGILAISVYRLDPEVMYCALPFLLLWMLSPLIGWYLSRMPEREISSEALGADDLLSLRRLARKTWRYFDDFVGEASHWLPPDNYQMTHRTELAMRTSPTNIGLAMLGSLTAKDLGFVPVGTLVERTEHTFETLDKLQRHEGHLLNWYDIQTLAPLEPRYVSTVDSGNLRGCLWTLRQGLREQAASPLIGPEALAGLADVLDILHEHADAVHQQDTARRAMDILDQVVRDPPSTAIEIIGRFRLAASPAAALSRALQIDNADDAEVVYWARQVEKHVAQWIKTIDQYLGWIEESAKSQEYVECLGPLALSSVQKALQKAPSLVDLSQGLAWVGATSAADSPTRLSGPDQPAPSGEVLWLKMLEASARASQDALQRIDALDRRCEELAAGMDMRFLYDSVRRLFSVGYTVNEGRRDESFFDLLASEARLASLVAIASGEVPNEHWLTLARPLRSIRGRRVLLSWSGTMFEYLMPQLLVQAFPNSLLDLACRGAVRVQEDYGRRRGACWGVSEAAFSALDVYHIYQYKAFGVPGLGLKRGLEDELVVAPYATALSLSIDPPGVMSNIRRLTKLGMMGPYGLFESFDYSRPHKLRGQEGLVVHAFMAHHQGMSLLAMGNFLCDQAMPRRFHADSRVQATEPLLYERIPLEAPMAAVPGADRPLVRMLGQAAGRPAGRFDTPHTPTPKTHIQSNGRYSVMVSNAGGGYSRWKEFDLTRWQADGTCDSWGSWCYLKDTQSGRVWSATYHPVRADAETYQVHFTSDHAEFRRTDEGIETLTDVVVAPTEDVEIRRVSVVNRSTRTRTIELTSYIELALAPHCAFWAHPAFSRMFVQTEALVSRGVLLACRRARAPDDPPIWAGCWIAGLSENPLTQFETDRAKFLGPGRTAANPQAISAHLSNSAGTVLDPVFAIRHQLTLAPGQRVRLAVVLAAGESRQAVLDLVDKYRDLAAAARVLELAWSRSQIDLRHLRITPEQAARFQQLASFLIYPSGLVRPPAGRLRQNKLGQSGLWALGISGDLPICVVSIAEDRDIDAVREVLQAHTYWRMHGLPVDLVILNERFGGYAGLLQDRLGALIRGHAGPAGIDKPGGVFLRNMDQMPKAEVTLLMAAARAVLVAARGQLGQQLSILRPAVETAPPLETAQWAQEEPSEPLEFMELPYFNGLGGFTPDGSEYAIYLGPGDITPVPWINVQANESFGQIVTSGGGGFVWAGNSQSNRLTQWANDPVTDASPEAIYILDEDSGTYWTPTPQPIRENDAYRVRHGSGYTVFEHNSHAINQELLTFVPVDEGEHPPIRIQRLHLVNRSSRRRRLSVTLYIEWTLGTQREPMHPHVMSQWDSHQQMLLARNPFSPDVPGAVAFVASSPGASSYTADRTLFLGRNGEMSSPAAMGRSGLSNRTGAGMDPCAALQVPIVLDPGQSATVIFLLGQAPDTGVASRLATRYRDPLSVEEAFQKTRQWWNETLGAVRVCTPDLSVNFLLNRWLGYQVLACRLWARSALYQSGGAFGFRDQLQDVMALLHSRPDMARQQIIRAAGRQYVEGDVQHWWHPQNGVGVRTRCSDDLLWLPYAVVQYVRVTGDVGILDASAPFVSGPALEPGRSEVLQTPQPSGQDGCVFEHCRRALEKGATAGPHGLPLFGSGDWNDGLNRVGTAGTGESTWLAWFLATTLADFGDLCQRRGKNDLAEQYREKARQYVQALDESGWDGKWYLRGFMDDGETLGSASNMECQIDSIAQSWAAICAQGDPQRAHAALDASWEHLVKADDRLVLLFKPPFNRTPADVGYIKGYPPGLRENGGQYTHAAVWLALAMAKAGDGDRAGKLLQLLNPVESVFNLDQVARYRVEPYVVAADVYSTPPHVGRGGWSWYTGAAGWMYRTWLEAVMGIDRQGSTLRISPAIPPRWDEYSVSYRFGAATYQIHVTNPDHVSTGVAAVELDGQSLQEAQFEMNDDGKTHTVEIRLGATVGSDRMSQESPEDYQRISQDS